MLEIVRIYLHKKLWEEQGLTGDGSFKISSNPLKNFSEQDLDEIGEGADYIGYSPEEKAAIAAGTKTPKIGDLLDFIKIEANKSAMKRYLG